MEKLLFIAFFFVSIINLSGQENYSFGVGVGLGEIKGNSAAVNTLSAQFHGDINNLILNYYALRMSIKINKKNNFLFENSIDLYFPTVYSIGIKAVLQEKYNKIILIEFGFGPAIMIDKIFKNETKMVWGVGIETNIGISLDKSGKSKIFFSSNYNLGLSSTRVRVLDVGLMYSYSLEFY